MCLGVASLVGIRYISPVDPCWWVFLLGGSSHLTWNTPPFSFLQAVTIDSFVDLDKPENRYWPIGDPVDIDPTGVTMFDRCCWPIQTDHIRRWWPIPDSRYRWPSYDIDVDVVTCYDIIRDVVIWPVFSLSHSHCSIDGLPRWSPAVVDRLEGGNDIWPPTVFDSPWKFDDW